ncbi:MAG: fatty acid desaturase [Myxococcota bacterium]
MSQPAVLVQDPRDRMRPLWGPLGRFLDDKLHDQRDAILVQDALISTMLIPFGLLLFVPNVFSWPLGIVYLALIIPRLGPTAVLLHMVSHRPLFNKTWSRLNHYIPWFMVLFYGMAPAGYITHHVGMHHVEENVGPDTSATLRYQRDSLWHFCLYWWRFQLIGKLELMVYLWRKRRFKLLRRLITGEVIHKSVLLMGALISLPATLLVFVIPYVIVRWGLMMGNWCQHAFIEDSDPACAYRNSVTLINCSYNERFYNDGYHCGHHIKATAHWADAPAQFEADVGNYARHHAVVFDGIRGFQTMWTLLMRRRYDVLAEHLVPWPGGPQTLEERMAFLKARTHPIREAT